MVFNTLQILRPWAKSEKKNFLTCRWMWDRCWDFLLRSYDYNCNENVALKQNFALG